MSRDDARSLGDGQGPSPRTAPAWQPSGSAKSHSTEQRAAWGRSQGSGVRDRGGVEGPSSFPRYRLSYFAVRSRYRSEKSKRQGTASHSNRKLEAGCLTDELIDSAY